ncbi:transposase [Xanthomonas citri pv. citri]|nr:transposase [Xanthomonas citri pv. citri]
MARKEEEAARQIRVKFTQKINLTLRFPHISSCEIKRLMGQAVEEGARMGHASR